MTVGIVTLVCGVICAVTTTLLTFAIIDQVNDKLPEGEKLAWLGRSPFKYRRLSQEYKRLYPNGRRLLIANVLTVVMFACFLVGAWGIGF